MTPSISGQFAEIVAADISMTSRLIVIGKRGIRRREEDLQRGACARGSPEG